MNIFRLSRSVSACSLSVILPLLVIVASFSLTSGGVESPGLSSVRAGYAPLTPRAERCKDRLIEYAGSLPSTGKLWKMAAASSVFTCTGRDSKLDPLL